ncbi:MULTISPECIES: Ig-like domain-containing protein [Sphingobacterium]|uniref:BIG2 domain-containing protein n=1 Tax=Sphingobacterium cellulitidis TaxID=1768011 RepID=A0A8H9G2I7_9SPHI|nr:MULTISPECIES: Ig-like domain-containing protein [Sphingobacterium]MBA8988521.1 uncharacterized protein YjdB [Sphingobacterium soli]WFB62790.1 Ig-like domain-containing protein [Sphingobacterium sp. WM]GGE33434.1 hypothetical protein GCM10011516_33910 [Sphingobacterium soli]
MKSNFLFAKYSLVLMAFVFIFISCSKDKEEAVPEKITKIEFIENEVQLLIGKSDTLHLAHYSQKLPKPKYKLTSSNPDVVSVNDLGIIKALKEGKSEITATLAEENLKARVIVNVLPIVPEKLKLELPNTNVFVGDSVIVKYSIDPPNTTNITSYSIDWTSSDPTIFTVKDAKIKGLKAGKAKLTANIRGTNVSSEIEINVKDVLAKTIELNSATGEVKVGEIFKLIATVKPENTTNKELVWESSNKTIATVVDGEVKGLKEGEVVITVKPKDGSVSATAKIKVVTIKVSKITLNETQGTMEVGQSFSLIANVGPADAHNKAVIWTSNNTTIATVDQNGNVFSKKEGTVVITVKSAENPSILATCTFKITPARVVLISLSESYKELNLGDKFTLYASVDPSNAQNKTIIWSSSNPQIATVDQNGIITAKSPGRVDIVATSQDNPIINNNCTIVVKGLDSDVKVGRSSSSITNINGFYTAVITHYISNLGDKKVTIKKMEVVDGFGQVKSANTEQFELFKNDQINYTSRFSNVYKPQFHYYFEIDGKQFKRVLTLD